MKGAEMKRKAEEITSREHVYAASVLGQEKARGQVLQLASDVVAAYGDVKRARLQGALADPTLNMEVRMLRQKIREKELTVASLREEIEANAFTQSSPQGAALVRKCKALLAENAQLGEEIHEERLEEFRGALYGEQRLNSELQRKCQDSADFCKELLNENDALQTTIARVAGRLRDARVELEAVERKRAEAKKRKKVPLSPAEEAE